MLYLNDDYILKYHVSDIKSAGSFITNPLSRRIIYPIINKIMDILGQGLACVLQSSFDSCNIRCHLSPSEIQAHIDGIATFYNWLYEHNRDECPLYNNTRLNMSLVSQEIWYAYGIGIWDGLEHKFEDDIKAQILEIKDELTFF